MHCEACCGDQETQADRISLCSCRGAQLKVCMRTHYECCAVLYASCGHAVQMSTHLLKDYPVYWGHVMKLGAMHKDTLSTSCVAAEVFARNLCLRNRTTTSLWHCSRGCCQWFRIWGPKNNTCLALQVLLYEPPQGHNSYTSIPC